MDNPWTHLPPRPPHVLLSDLSAIVASNQRVGGDHQLHTELLLEVFLGDLLAPIVLSNLNPGFSDRTSRYTLIHASRRSVSETCCT